LDKQALHGRRQAMTDHGAVTRFDGFPLILAGVEPGLDRVLIVDGPRLRYRDHRRRGRGEAASIYEFQVRARSAKARVMFGSCSLRSTIPVSIPARASSLQLVVLLLPRDLQPRWGVFLGDREHLVPNVDQLQARFGDSSWASSSQSALGLGYGRVGRTVGDVGGRGPPALEPTRVSSSGQSQGWGVAAGRRLRYLARRQAHASCRWPAATDRFLKF
jgi:hypothetical protein